MQFTTDGSTLLANVTSGSAAPSGGANGDVYLKTDGAVYSKVGGTWVQLVPATRTVAGHALSADVTVSKDDVGLGSVENTALSTWPGTTNITTLGSIATGSWHGTSISTDHTDAKVTSAAGRTGAVTFTAADIGAGTFPTGTFVFDGHFLPNATDTYDAGSALKWWRNSYFSQMNSVLMAYNQQTILAGWNTTGHDAGVIAASVGTGSTTVDFGKAMTTGDFVVIRSKDATDTAKVEYMQVGAVVAGTVYNVTRDLAGAHGTDPAWTAGTPFLVLGTTNDGRVSILANPAPLIVGELQGATYNASTDIFAIGDLNGHYGVGTSVYGLGVGKYANGSSHLLVTPADGVVMKARSGGVDTERFHLAADGSGHLANAITWDTGGTATVGGWTLASDSLTGGNAGLYNAGYLKLGTGDNVIYVSASNANYRLWAGKDDETLAPFAVTIGGAVRMTQATITGPDLTLGTPGSYDPDSALKFARPDYTPDAADIFGLHAESVYGAGFASETLTLENVAKGLHSGNPVKTDTLVVIRAKGYETSGVANFTGPATVTLRSDETHSDVTLSAGDATFGDPHNAVWNGATFSVDGSLSASGALATTGSVGVGTSPSYKLDVAENLGSAWGARVVNSHATGHGMLVRGGSGTSYYSQAWKDYADNYIALLYGGGNLWVGADVSALTFTDRTPWPEGKGLDLLRAVKGARGQLDHASLPAALRAEAKNERTGEVELGRNLSATVSALIQAAQELDARVTALEKK